MIHNILGNVLWSGYGMFQTWYLVIPIPFCSPSSMSFAPTHIHIFLNGSWVQTLLFVVVFHDKCIFGTYQSFCFPMNPGLLQSWITFKVGKVCSAGWADGRGVKVSLFTHSSSSLSQAASRHITTRIIASFHPDVLNFAFFTIFFVHFMFCILNVMCGGYCHLMNVLSVRPSSLILIHFRGSMPLWLGQKNAFNIEIGKTKGIITSINFVLFPFSVGMQIAIFLSGPYPMSCLKFKYSAICILEQWSLTPDGI